MCIVLLTTSHPDYALIVIDNRDEFILRPTSRPHWWTASENEDSAGDDDSASASASASQQVLSSRDLQRPEHGTWLGVTKAGHFSVLTNFREETPHDVAHPVAGQRSRGGMVTAWLTADPHETTEHFVERMLEGQGVKGVGGFSLICGKLRKSAFAGPSTSTSPSQQQHHEQQLPPQKGALAVISNRADELAHVPWIAGQRGEVHGLSNASFEDPDVWPKVSKGRALLERLVVARPPATEDELRDGLFAILDDDTLPRRADLSFEEHIPLLKNSIFVPALGDDAHRKAMKRAVSGGLRSARDDTASVPDDADADAELAEEERPDPTMGFMTGLYGTQRQTVVLVDWDGRVSFTERALYDANGNAVPRGQGDAHFEFQIEGWNDDAEPVSNGNGKAGSHVV